MKTSGNEGITMSSEKSSGIAHKFLRIFTAIHPHEVPTALLLSLNVFILMSGYYVIKPIREGLILHGKGPEVKSYLGAVIAILFIPVIKIFSNVVSRFPRQKFITWITLFFISNLIIFYFLHLINIPLGTMGIIFFVWIAIFNLMVVAQFWGFTNDIYTEEAGKRLFPLVMFGQNCGALLGPIIYNSLVRPLGQYKLMLVVGGMLGVCILFTLIIHKREIRRKNYEAEVKTQKETTRKEEEKPLKKGGGFRLVFKSQYLLYIALVIFLLNWVNTNGEYILGKVITHDAAKAIETGTAGELDKSELIGKLYSNFYFGVNLIAAILQLFLMSRIFKWFGVRGALLILPLVAFGGYFFIGLGASLVIVRWVKTFENSTDYSIMNATRHALFLITSREVKYKAQAAIETFFWRAGDVMSALVVAVAAAFFAFDLEKSVAGVASVNIFLIIIWIILCILIARSHKKLSAQRAEYQVG